MNHKNHKVSTIETTTSIDYPPMDTGEGILGRVRRHKGVIAVGAAAALAAGILIPTGNAPAVPKPQAPISVKDTGHKPWKVQLGPNETNPYDLINSIEPDLTEAQKLAVAKNIASQGSILESDGVTHELAPGDVVEVPILTGHTNR